MPGVVNHRAPVRRPGEDSPYSFDRPRRRTRPDSPLQRSTHDDDDDDYHPDEGVGRSYSTRRVVTAPQGCCSSVLLTGNFSLFVVLALIVISITQTYIMVQHNLMNREVGVLVTTTNNKVDAIVREATERLVKIRDATEDILDNALPAINSQMNNTTRKFEELKQNVSDTLTQVFSDVEQRNTELNKTVTAMLDEIARDIQQRNIQAIEVAHEDLKVIVQDALKSDELKLEVKRTMHGLSAAMALGQVQAIFDRTDQLGALAQVIRAVNAEHVTVGKATTIPVSDPSPASSPPLNTTAPNATASATASPATPAAAPPATVGAPVAPEAAPITAHATAPPATVVAPATLEAAIPAEEDGVNKDQL